MTWRRCGLRVLTPQLPDFRSKGADASSVSVQNSQDDVLPGVVECMIRP